MMNQKDDDWVHYEGSSLADFPHHDGDSFRVVLAHGGLEDFRLYFVDTPESRFKTYRDGNDNGERIAQQGEYFGGLSQEVTTALGRMAKEATVGLLSAGNFDLFTRYEEVFDSGRFYCVVRCLVKGEARWLDEILVENGLARIITQPTVLPDGTSAERHQKRLRHLESRARKSGRGGWK
jgi:endonuclease YncB( thermonuclease family)